MPLRSATAAALLALSLAGCQSPPSYRVRTERVQKDALQIIVRLAEPLDTRAYDAIARAEIARVRSVSWVGEAPLYEVKVDFLLDGPRGPARLATCAWRAEALETAAAALPGGLSRQEGLR